MGKIVLPALLLALFFRIFGAAFLVPVHAELLSSTRAQITQAVDVSSPVGVDNPAVEFKMNKRHRHSREHVLKHFVALPSLPLLTPSIALCHAPELPYHNQSTLDLETSSRPPTC